MPKHFADFQTTISGIPCQIEIHSTIVVPPFHGPAHRCESDLDYYGYSEIEYTILDRTGYPAPWLERKLTPSDLERIDEEIISYKQSLADPY